MADRSPSEGWAEYRRLVLAALERYEEQIESLRATAGSLENRVTQAERLNGALRTAVFGSSEGASLQTRIALLEKFTKEHPSLIRETEGEDSGPSKKVDKKMLFLLVGALAGMISLLGKALDIILQTMGG